MEIRWGGKARRRRAYLADISSLAAEMGRRISAILGHLPLKDVAAAGGWKSEAVLLRHYQQPDEATLLWVITGGVELREQQA